MRLPPLAHRAGERPVIEGKIETRRPRIVAFHGGKGGAGATTLAAETVFALAAAGRRVVAVDLDLYRGDLHYRLDVPVTRGTHTIVDLLPVIGELDDRILANALSECPCGASLLPAPGGGDGSDLVEPEHIVHAVASLGSAFDHVVIDTPPRLDALTAAALGCADEMVMVLTPEVAGVGCARNALDALVSRVERAPRIFTVVNRSLGGADLLTLRDVESFLGAPVSLVLPEEAARCRRSADEGRPVSGERSALGRGVTALARRLFGVTS